MNMKNSLLIALSVLSIAGFCLADTTELLGAGATFPQPLYAKMFDVYNKEKGVQVNYQGIGSGGGIKQLNSKTVDFGASDAFMSDTDLAAMPAKVVHIPTCLGSEAIVYNLPNNPELKLSPAIIAGIFLGTIKSWDDPSIQKANPKEKLPKTAIIVAHRSDGSGTTAIFTDYLSKVSKDWKDKVGAGKSVNWPVGIGGKGNAGVAGLVKETPGAIGYVEYAYAVENKMTYATLRNASGKFLKPSIESTIAAADTPVPEDTRVSITNTDNPKGYPIVGFTWLLVYQDQSYDNRTMNKAKAVVDLLNWVIHSGQQYATPLKYARLPLNVQQKAEDIVSSITFGGTPILSK